ncbi:unknown protein [Seminavis robusta]|uniref:Uncharacterized protein n=1 Tax=Seminavis robusta TaxID=568900 RepID=A0A9N8F0G5_9STRA|nr:unknown protein [Seminavis robusta]|eukprot:Sro3525_g348920.1 n/a (246) ;mRNA; r:1563-2300
MSNSNSNNNDNYDADLLKIAELRLQLGTSENCQEEDESKQTQDDHDGSSSHSSPDHSLAATAAAPPAVSPLPTSTTRSGFGVKENTTAASLETAGDLELVELTQKFGATLPMGHNSHDRTTDDAHSPLHTIPMRQPEYFGQPQTCPGAYAVVGPCFATDSVNHSNAGRNTGASDGGFYNLIEEIADNEVIAHPIDDDQQIDLLPNAVPLPTNQRSRDYYRYWRQKLLCFLSVEINVAFLLYLFFS